MPSRRGEHPGDPGDDRQHAEPAGELEGDRGGHHQEGEDQQHADDRHREGDHDAEREIEPEVPPAGASSPAAAACSGSKEIVRNRRRRTQWNTPTTRVDRRQPDDRRPGDPEQAPDQDVLDRLAAPRGLVGHQQRRRRGHHVHDADDRLLRHPALAVCGAGQGEQRRAGGGEPERVDEDWRRIRLGAERRWPRSSRAPPSGPARGPRRSPRARGRGGRGRSGSPRSPCRPPAARSQRLWSSWSSISAAPSGMPAARPLTQVFIRSK